MRGQRLKHLLVWLVIGAGMAWSIYDWLIVDGGLRFFAEDHRRILLLLLIVAVGTPIQLGYLALSDERKRRVALWLVGSFAVGMTAFAIYIGYGMIRLDGFLFENKWWMGLLAPVIPFLMAAGLWWAFCRIRRGKRV